MGQILAVDAVTAEIEYPHDVANVLLGVTLAIIQQLRNDHVFRGGCEPFASRDQYFAATAREL